MQLLSLSAPRGPETTEDEAGSPSHTGPEPLGALREAARFFFGSCIPSSQPGQSMGMGAFWQRARGDGGEWTSGMHLLRRVPEVCANADSFAV